MAIVTAVYNNFSETIILVTYDDGRPATEVPDDLANTDRQEVASWEAMGNTITPFVDAPGRLAEARQISRRRLRRAYRASLDTQNISDGTFTFDMDETNTFTLLTSLACNPRIPINMIDDGNISRVENVGEQNTIAQNLRDNTQTLQSNFISERQAIGAAADVAALDTVLINSSFGNLGPVYG